MRPGPGLTPREAGCLDGQRQDSAPWGGVVRPCRQGGSCPPGAAQRVCEEGGARADAPAPGGENVAGGSCPDGSCIVNPPQLAPAVGPGWARGRCEGTPWPAQPGVPSVVTSPHFPYKQQGREMTLPSPEALLLINANPGINLITRSLSPRGWASEAPCGITSCLRLLGRLFLPGCQALPRVPVLLVLQPTPHPCRFHLILILPHL